MATASLRRNGWSTRRRFLALAAGTATAALAGLGGCGPTQPIDATEIERFAEDLHNPRGIAFDDRGNLLIAESGHRGAADSGRISRISPDGRREILVDGLPYSTNTGGEDTGATAVAARAEAVFILFGTGPQAPAQRVLRWDIQTELGRFSNLGFVFSTEIGPGTGRNPFDMAFAPDGFLWVVDTAGNEILRIGPDGEIFETFGDLVDSDGRQQVPTGIAFGPDGRAHVAMFSARPHPPGTAWIASIDAAGNTRAAMRDLTMAIDVTFDVRGALYALEFASHFDLDEPEIYAPNSGRVTRQHNGQRETIAIGLPYPTSLAIGPDGHCYVALGGAFGGAGEGLIGRFALPGLA